MIGPLIGGWLVTNASWRWVFLINVPFAVATFAPRRLRGAEARAAARSAPKVDFVGAALCVLGLGGPVFALIEEPKRGWGDPLILATLLGGLALFARVRLVGAPRAASDAAAPPVREAATSRSRTSRR